MVESSKASTSAWRKLLMKSFLVGVVTTALLCFLLKDIEGGYYQSSLQLSVQTLASCLIGGALVGVILPIVPFQAVGFHAALSTLVGTVIYFLLSRVTDPMLLPYLYYDIVSNLLGSVIGGFMGGVLGSLGKRLMR
jgi:hypothetical protein